MPADLIDLNQVTPAATDPKETFALDILMGLSTKPKRIPPRYFYDTKGSELFKKITDSSDYYPTRCEAEIFETHKTNIAELVKNGPLNVIELGAGDGRKTRVLLEEMMKVSDEISYIPIDISASANTELVEKFEKELKGLPITGVIGEYFKALDWIRDHKKGRNLVMFLGSNIGNFSLPEARVFLRTLWNSLNDGDLALIGFDFKKDIDLMLYAYNDRGGVTREFNLNLLDRINEELGANFDRSKFTHYGTYNVHIGAMESFLISLKAQKVYVKHLNKEFHFKPYEPIHVEYSFKFLPSDIEDLGFETGFKLEEIYYDSKRYFADGLLRVEKK